MAEYEHVVSGSADRIIKIAEGQVTHRHSQERACLDADIRLERYGQWLPFCLGMVAILGSMVLIVWDKRAEGLTGLIAAIAALAGLSAWSRYREERSPNRPDPANVASELDTQLPTDCR